MRILLAADNTITLDLEALAQRLNTECATLRFTSFPRRIRVPDEEIDNATYRRLDPEFIEYSGHFDLTIAASFAPYENNHFFDAPGSVFIVSFHEWHVLTDLGVANGLVYFIASLVADSIGLGQSHEENTGCLNDYWWDKTGVDVGMRAAFVCRACREGYTGSPESSLDVQRLLDVVSTSSRSGTDIAAPVATRTIPTFDVFLCHSSVDKPVIRQINSALRLAGIVTWFDEEQLKPGQLWQEELENQIEQVRNACVFVGDNSRGPWQNMEMRAFLSEFVNRRCTVIPVILPGTVAAPELPIFLRQLHWLDLREAYDEGIARLAELLRSN